MKTNTEEMINVINRITLRTAILNDNERSDMFCRELYNNLTKKTNSTYSVLISNSEASKAYAKISVKNTANKTLTSNDIYDAMMNAITSVFPIISPSSVGLFDLVLYNESGFTIYV